MNMQQHNNPMDGPPPPETVPQTAPTADDGVIILPKQQ